MSKGLPEYNGAIPEKIIDKPATNPPVNETSLAPSLLRKTI